MCVGGEGFTAGSSPSNPAFSVLSLAECCADGSLYLFFFFFPLSPHFCFFFLSLRLFFRRFLEMSLPLKRVSVCVSEEHGLGSAEDRGRREGREQEEKGGSSCKSIVFF